MPTRNLPRDVGPLILRNVAPLTLPVTSMTLNLLSSCTCVLYCASVVLPFEKIYLENLPCAEMYQKSYMHRDVITHVLSTKYDNNSRICYVHASGMHTEGIPTKFSLSQINLHIIVSSMVLSCTEVIRHSLSTLYHNIELIFWSQLVRMGM